MNLRLQLSLVLLFAAVFSSAQQKAFTKNGNQFSFISSAKNITIEFCTPAMFRVRSAANGAFEPNEPWMVVNYNWALVAVTSSETKDAVRLQTSALTVSIKKGSFAIDVFTKEGRLLSSEAVSGGGISNKGEAVSCVKNLSPDEHFFGFGERMDFLDRRGKELKLNVGRGKGLPHAVGAYNVLEANYCPVPFFMSTAGYGIFFHNAFPTQWDMGSKRTDAYSFGADGGEMDYYFILGPKFNSIVSQYTALTGRAPLMPKAAYGLHMGTYSGGTWGYEHLTSDQYVMALARKMRELGIPVDLLWLDSTWRIFGEVGGKGATSFEWRETFQNPKGMFDSLYAMNYKMVGVHLRPRFDNGKKIKLLDTAQRLKFTYPEGNNPGEFVNFFDASSVDFWWNRGVMRVASLGARFLKTDEGSAFGALANESNKIGPQGPDIPKLHNLFPLAYAKAPYEKFQQFNNLRGLNQTREGYAGIQRYPYIFAGDWPSEWQYFAPVIKAGINIGLSGVGAWAHCAGGFEHVADPELYIRWIQFGMFSPVALVFGMDHPGYKEPWNYGADALRNFKKYDSLRYTLLPYIYSYAYEMNQTGAPLMRALVFDHQDDQNVYEIGDQYLFGRDLMVCPVTTKGAHTRSIYLPEGEWYDWWSGKKYSGKGYIHVVTPLDTMPVFARAGAIIPQQPSMGFVGEKKVDVLTLDVFPGKNSSFNLYEDDEESLAYQQKAFSITNISLTQSAKQHDIKINRPQGMFKPSPHRYVVKFHTVAKPKSVVENGKPVTTLQNTGENKAGWYFNGEENILYISTLSDNTTSTHLIIHN
ncbi:MAG TPA: TIM-barrel domain-containing protein [Flavisolibacter sp.]